MAIIVDAAGDAEATVLCAEDEFVQPTADLSWPRGFIIKASVADGAIVDDTPPTPVVQAAYPVIDFTDFWLNSVPATERFV